MRMGMVTKFLHPKSAREAARNIAIGAASLVAGTWFIAWLSQFKVFENPQGQVSAITEFLGWLITQSWFLWLSGIVAGFAVGVWVDAWLVRRSAKRWWHNVQAFSIRDAACLLASIKRSEFEKSDRAAAIASELRGYVNSGQVPTFLEFEFEKPLPDFSDPKAKYEPPYDKKDVGLDAVISKVTVEGIARGRQWPLPWPIPPRSEKDHHRPFPRPRPAPPEPQALADLLSADKYLGTGNFLGKLGMFAANKSDDAGKT